MKNVVQIIVLVFIFTVPWENTLLIENIGTASRFIGYFAALTGLFYVVAFDKIRYNQFLIFFFLFFTWNSMTVFWTIDVDRTIGRMINYASQLAMMWLIYQVADQKFLMRSFVALMLGSWIYISFAVHSFIFGITVVYERYAAAHFDANDGSIYLMLAATIAAFLANKARSLSARLLCLAHLPAAFFCIAISGSRSGFVAALISLPYLAYTLQGMRWPTRLFLGSSVAGALVLVSDWVPTASIERLSGTGGEILAGTWNQRLVVWEALVLTFSENSFIGTGAGTSRVAVYPYLGHESAPHNAFLAIATETGIIGITLFLLAIFSAMPIFRSKDPGTQIFWLTIFVILLMALMTLNFEWRKMTWLILILCSAHLAVENKARSALDGAPRTPRYQIRSLSPRPR